MLNLQTTQLQPHPNQKDFQSLQQIIKAAQRIYLKERKINPHNSTFNLLKVLAAYKQQYPQNDITIYNLIIYIMQRFKPRNVDDWLWGLTQIYKEKYQSVRKKKEYSSYNQYIKFKSQSLNRTNNIPVVSQQKDLREYTSRSKSSINSKIMLASFIQQCHHKKTQNSLIQHDDLQSQILSDRSKINKQNTPINKINQIPQQPHISINSYLYGDNSDISQNTKHYISFQPKQNKENLIDYYDDSSCNFTSKQTQQSFYRRMHEKSSSANFIKKKNNSQHLPSYPSLSKKHTQSQLYNDTQFISNSKVTNFTKDITQVEQQSEEQYNMRLRAQNYHNINCYLKIFSVFLANFQVYAEYREQRNKALVFYRDCIKRKAFINLQINKEETHYYKKKQKKYESYSECMTKKRVFNIFKILYDTKVQSMRKINVHQLNRVNIEFMFAILVDQLKEQNYDQNNQNNSLQINTPKNLSEKGDYFLQTGNISKFQMLLKNFGNFKPTNEQIINLHKLRDRKTKELILKTFKAIYCQKIFLKNKYSIEFKKKYFNAIKGYCLRQKNLNKIYFIVNASNRFKLQQKAFKALITCVFSAKLYNKRAQYIVEKRKINLSHNAIKVWYQQLRKLKNNRASLNENLQKLLFLIQKIQRKLYFSDFMDGIKKIKQQYLKQIFVALKQQVQQRKKCKIIQKQIQNKILKQRFQQWNSSIKVIKGIRKIDIYFKKCQLNNIYCLLQRKSIQTVHIENNMKILKYNCFIALIQYSKQIKQQINHNISLVKNMLNKNNFRQFTYNIKQNSAKQTLKCNMQKMLKIQIKYIYNSLNQIYSQKNNFQAQILHCMKISELKMKRRFINNLQENTKQEQLLLNKYNLSVRNMKIKRQQNILIELINIKNHKFCKQRIMEYLNDNKIKQFKSNLYNTVIKRRYSKIKLNIQRKTKSKIMKEMKSRWQKNQQNVDKANKFFYYLMGQKLFICLVNRILDMQEKGNKLNEIRSHHIKHQSLQFFKHYMSKHKRIQQSSQTIKIKQTLKLMHKLHCLKKKKQILQSKMNIQFKQETLNLLKTNYIGNISINIKNQELQCKSKSMLKALFFKKFHHYFIQKMLMRKYNCMALKFRVNKLQQHAFTNLCIKIVKKYKKRCFNTSTEYSNI